jgi:ArsR family transcriptional regulator, arsenate/arsenite/antimonite-responsive transcriptional repressor
MKCSGPDVVRVASGEADVAPLDDALIFHYIGNVKLTSVVPVLAALAQETRLAIFRLLVERGPQGMAAGGIAEALELAAATLSFHLKELTRANLISARQAGRFIYYSANYRTINELVAYLTENCCRGSACDIACAPAPKLKRKAS